MSLLFLENELAPGVFTPDRLVALELIAAQVAISLENALLLEREHEGRVEAEAASRRALILGEATALVSSTFDYKDVFARAHRLCVRELCQTGRSSTSSTTAASSVSRRRTGIR